MTIARTARALSLRHLVDLQAVRKHFVVVSSNAEEASYFAVCTANMFGFGASVGGRCSMDSVVCLSTMFAIGAENFRAMLAGFHALNEHIRSVPLKRNLPVLVGLLAVWYNNCFQTRTVAALPCHH